MARVLRALRVIPNQESAVVAGYNTFFYGGHGALSGPRPASELCVLMQTGRFSTQLRAVALGP
jgi:hypothetical protein